MSPLYISRDDVPEEVAEHERELYRSQALDEGKPEHIVDRIVEGRMEKYYQQICLLEQEFIRDDEQTIDELLKEQINTTGENIVIRRFARYQLGESLGE
jgi:elongation factor Ts